MESSRAWDWFVSSIWWLFISLVRHCSSSRLPSGDSVHQLDQTWTGYYGFDLSPSWPQARQGMDPSLPFSLGERNYLNYNIHRQWIIWNYNSNGKYVNTLTSAINITMIKLFVDKSKMKPIITKSLMEQELPFNVNPFFSNLLIISPTCNMAKLHLIPWILNTHKP